MGNVEESMGPLPPNHAVVPWDMVESQQSLATQP